MFVCKDFLIWSGNVFEFLGITFYCIIVCATKHKTYAMTGKGSLSINNYESTQRTGKKGQTKYQMVT